MKNLIKLTLFNIVLINGLYAQCIGNDYEQNPLLSESIIESLSITGTKSKMSAEESMQLTQNVKVKEGYDDSTLFYYVCTDSGQLEMVKGSDNYKTVKYIAPDVSTNKVAKIDFKVGDGYGYTYYKRLEVEIEAVENFTLNLQANYTAFKNQTIKLSVFTSNIKDEDNAIYNWDFGDGITASGKSVEHTYSATGTYRPKVTVIYNGETKTATTEVKVKEPTVSEEKDITNWKQLINGRYNDVIFADNRLVAVGAKGNIATSTDGINWQIVEYNKKDDIGDLVAVTYGNGKWVAVGGTYKKGVTVVSTDGLHWSVINSYATAKITDVHFANNLFVKVGAKSIKSYSIDGENWHSGYFGTIINGASADFTSVTYDNVNDKWIAVGTARGDLIYTSTDGNRWNENSFKPSGVSLNDIDSYGGKTIAVAYKSSSPRGGIVLISNDGGITWSSQQLVNNNPIVAINHTSLGWFGSVGNGDIVFSKDGDSWESRKTNRNQWCTSFVYIDTLNKLIASGHTWNLYQAQPQDSRREFQVSLSVHDGGRVTYIGGSCRSGSCSPLLVKESDTLILKAKSDNGYEFLHWSGDCYGDGECSLNISSNKRVEAHFKKLIPDTDKDGIPNDQDLDDDNDGISDIAEIANGLNPLDPTDATADNDGDGYTNAQEIAKGTDINDASSKPTPNVATRTITIHKGFGLYGMNSSMTLAQLIEKIGVDNLLSINSNGATYQLAYVKDGLEFLNDFKQLEPFKAVWIEVANEVEIDYDEINYTDDQEITIEGDRWYLLNPPKAMSLEEIKSKVGESNIEIIQGLTTTYQQKYVDEGTDFLNDFTGFTEPNGYWIKLKESAVLSF